MSDTPMAWMLDAVEWQPLASEEPPKGCHVATHEGVLQFGPFLLRVFQLSNGQRVIAEEDLAQFFGFTEVADDGD